MFLGGGGIGVSADDADEIGYGAGIRNLLTGDTSIGWGKDRQDVALGPFVRVFREQLAHKRFAARTAHVARGDVAGFKGDPVAGRGLPDQYGGEGGRERHADEPYAHGAPGHPERVRRSGLYIHTMQ